ncbi:MAG TPA: YebC/PmpR family DNA-binding transcriptional regulator, partial [Candidatus Paceibacterota bacterium]
MSGHNKFSKIKHQKAKNDAQKSKIFSKLVRFITVEA